MKIVNLVAENVKKLTAIDITPNDNLVMVTGKNGAGKSSVLDCIVMALCGGRSIPQVPIKKGKDKGKIVIDLGDHQITRSFTKEGSYLKIVARDGVAMKSPQKFLDTIVGNISFDPLEFLNNEEKKQRDILLNLIGVNVDALDKEDERLREERKVIGRELNTFESQIKAIKSPPEHTPDEEISATDLTDKLQDAMTFNSSIQADTIANENIRESAKREIQDVKNKTERIAAIMMEVKNLEEDIVRLNQTVSEKKEQYIAKKKEIAERVPIDIDEIRKEIASIGILNQAVRIKKDWLRLKGDVAASKKRYDQWSEKIAKITSDRADMLSKAKMPVAGLSFDDGGLLYNGIPLAQASDGEKLMVSLGISMAINPTLKVLRIKDGSLLDQSNRKIINDMIHDKDYQLWFETVGVDSEVGILIEEGEIIKVDGVPAAPSPARAEISSESKPDSPKEVNETMPQDVIDDFPDVTQAPQPTPDPNPNIDW